MSKNTKVVLGLAGESPASAPPLFKVATMLSKHDGAETLVTFNDLRKLYSPKLTFSKKSTSCELICPFWSVSRLASWKEYKPLFAVLGFAAYALR